MKEISVKLSENFKNKPKDTNNLGFGSIFTDHMFIMDYDQNKGWYDPRIVPYAPICLDPASICLHYAQEVFEGMKAYRTDDDRILLFRPEENLKRMNISNDRLCIPKVDEDFCVEAIKKLVSLERDWVPKAEGTSLYIRPFIIGVDNQIGVHPAEKLLFIVICCPVGAYYPEGLNPVKIYVEKEYVRAINGGTGLAKTGGNYAGSLKAQYEANKKGFSQVLWLDGIEKKYIEEVGTMNVFFIIDDKIITPDLNGTILPGITRMSAIELLKSLGYNVEERRISIDEIISSNEDGKLKEAFGTGTAAVVSPIGELYINEKPLIINEGKIGDVAKILYETLTSIQYGKINDKFGWTIEVK